MRVYNLNVLPGPFSEPPVATVGLLSTDLITGNENQLATVKFNYPSTTAEVQIQTSEEAMTKFTESLKETFGWNVGAIVWTKITENLHGAIACRIRLTKPARTERGITDNAEEAFEMHDP